MEFTVVCTIAADGDDLVLGCRHGREQIDRRLIGAAAGVLQLESEHRRMLRESWQPDVFDLWADATTRYLAGVHGHVGRPMRQLLGPSVASVALRVEESLRRVPFETAHDVEHPALFESVLVCRIPPGANPIGTGCATASEPRSFRFTSVRSPNPNLPACAIENHIVQNLHVGRCAVRGAEPLVHVAGHHPRADIPGLDPERRAHVVLAGCDSLPTQLPPGVGSVCGSLWPVDDRTMPEFMASYHTELSRGQGPAVALRNAQLMHRHLPPVTWASFVHMGQAW